MLQRAPMYLYIPAKDVPRLLDEQKTRRGESIYGRPER